MKTGDRRRKRRKLKLWPVRSKKIMLLGKMADARPKQSLVLPWKLMKIPSYMYYRFSIIIFLPMKALKEVGRGSYTVL